MYSLPQSYNQTSKCKRCISSNAYTALYKYFDVEAVTTGKCDLNFTLYRLPEVMFIYAESYTMATGNPDQLSYDMINSIRNRAGLSPLSGLNKDEFIQAVWKERAHELCYENKEYFDIQRTHKAYNLKTDRFENYNSFTNESGTTFSEKYLLWPIPSTETDVNPKGEHKNVFHRELQTQKATVCIIRSGECEYTLKNQLMMSMLSQLLTMEYTETVREDEGASYGVGVSGDISLYPKVEATLQISFDTNPEKRAKMSSLIDKGINDFIANGPKAENLQKVKEYMLKNYEANQKENGYWMNILYSYFWENSDMATGYADTVNGITAADLQHFAKDFFSQNNRIEVSMTSGDTK